MKEKKKLPSPSLNISRAKGPIVFYISRLHAAEGNETIIRSNFFFLYFAAQRKGGDSFNTYPAPQGRFRKSEEKGSNYDISVANI